MKSSVFPSFARLRSLFLFVGLIVLLQSCTAAGFDKAHPAAAKPEKDFPSAMLGTWESVELSEYFYINKLTFEPGAVTYDMSALAEGSPGVLTLVKDSVELRKMKKDYVFNIAGDSLWLCFIIRQPSRNSLEIYGFDETAKRHVKRYETENGEQGIEFVKYYATDKEWESLVTSPALKKVGTYKRTKP